MSPVHLRDLGFQRYQPEDREGLSRTRRPERGHLGHSSGWQNNEGDNINPAIHTPIQWRPQTTGLERHGSKVQPAISLGRTWSKFPEDLSQKDRLQRPDGNHQRLESYQAVEAPGGKGTEDKGESSHYPSYRKTVNPDRAYSDSFRLTRRRPNQLSSGFTPFKKQKISGQELPFFTIPGSFQEKTRKQGQEQNLLQPEEERVRPNDSEAVGFGKRSAQEPDVIVNHSRISSPSNRNITPTQTEHNIVTSESNINSDTLWLQMSQFAKQSAKQFSELESVATTGLTLLLDGCGNPTWSQIGANWPRHIIYGPLAPFGCSRALTPQPIPMAIYGLHHLLWPQAISCRHWPSWPIHTSPTPRPSSLILGLGGSFLSSRGLQAP
ncbi:hypothetical protein O181_038130 [Austropuccinia psidii MF-1]|uniref:Uncharacterized protein n=1 Tax=Austropuccinia psidii MF-1 TaxID=1389203 RepID=A0A9Q3HDU8_9BASI|nr:hypothetical protein [Austropuccinia psidii MF-1]